MKRREPQSLRHQTSDFPDAVRMLTGVVVSKLTGLCQTLQNLGLRVLQLLHAFNNFALSRFELAGTL